MAFYKLTHPFKVAWPENITYGINQKVLMFETYMETESSYMEVNQSFESKYLRSYA